MTRVQTYVFVDLETTGLPAHELNKTRITEMSMVAVKRQHFLDTRPGATPRVQQKLTLCFNPLRRIDDGATITTGLCNDLLEHEPQFNNQTFTIIDNFLNILSQPVCLIAQNGLGFDFPILKNHLVKLKCDFTSDILCADCYHAFYDIEQKFKQVEKKLISNSNTKERVENGDKKEDDISPNKAEVPSSTKQTDFDDNDYYTSNISMQAKNETTPKVTRAVRVPHNVSKARRQLYPWGDGPKPKDSYKLSKIYERVLNKKAVDAHRAENDCIFALEISVAWNKEFVEWVDLNHVKFSDIEPMAIGVPMRKK